MKLRLLLLAMMCVAPLHGATPVTLCDILADPPAYDRRVIDVTVFVSYGFEDFTLLDPLCSDRGPRVWAEFGGTYERESDQPLTVDGIQTSIVRDQKLKRFDHLLRRDGGSIVRAKLRGRFFAGEKTELPGGTFWTGYGHFGMFSLFVIEQILEVEPHDLRDVDYSSSIDQPPIDGIGCYSRQIGGTSHAEAIALQRQVDSGTSPWSVDDPRRVAEERLRAAAGRTAASDLQIVRKAPGRVVFRAAVPNGAKEYWIVVARPYWLTFYAAKRQRVAWLPLALYEAGCRDVTAQSN